MDCAEFTPKRPRARYSRVCPECRETIPAKSRYVCYGGIYDGDIFHGTACEECYAFLDRYMTFLKRMGFEAEYRQGEIIQEAAEHVNFYIQIPDQNLSLSDKRDLLLAYFKIIERRRRLAKAA